MNKAENKPEQIGVRVGPRLRIDAERLARRRKTTLSRLVRELLEREIESARAGKRKRTA